MTDTLRIIEPLGERMATLPLALGGEATDALRLPGVPQPVAMLESGDRAWQVRPVPGMAVTLNGLPLQQATTLDAGDVLTCGEAQLVVWPAESRIEARHLAGNTTVAPVLQQVLPGDAVVAGVREIFAAGTASGDAPALAATRAPRGGLPRVALYSSAALVLLLIAVWLIRLVPVGIELDPAAATMKSLDGFAWRAGDRVFLLPGRHRLQFSSPGHRDEQVTLDVSRALADAKPLVVRLALEPGRLQVDSHGIEGELLVDGRVAGKVPGEVAVQAGMRELLVRAPRHLDFPARLTIEGGGKVQRLDAPLQSSLGWLVLDTQPAGARVLIDGAAVGAAPQRVELIAGLHQLAIEAPGRRAWRSEIGIIAGQTLDLGRIDLAAAAPARLGAVAPPAVAQTSGAEGSAATGDAPAAAPPPRQPPAPRVQSALLGELVLLPAGQFTQGSDRREQGRRANEVQRPVTLTRAFYLAANEVSNAQFRAFRGTHASGIALEKSLDLDPQAVTGVSWNDAVEFCNWLSLREGLPAAYERRDGRWQLVTPHNRGYRLPTEAEWEYAARYADGRRWQRYAWGDALPPPANAENLAGEESLPPRPGPDVRLAAALPGWRDAHAVIAPVGSYARSPMGLHDMGGNVSEWMHDVYASLPEATAVTDPFGPEGDGAHAIRGANWRTAAIAELRLAWRERGNGPAQTLGFRVARFAEEAP